MQTQIQELTQELEAKPVNHNNFYKRFRDETLSQEQLRRFAKQYFWFCDQFITVLVGLIYNTPSNQGAMRLELIKTLYSEMGYGKEENIHLNLLRRFTTALGINEEELQTVTPTPKVAAYIEGLDELFTRSDFRKAVGAEFGVEVTAALEFTYLSPGIEKYKQFTKQDIYFFPFHLAEEELHSDWLTQAVLNICQTEEDLALIREGALKAADLWGEFWEGMEAYVFAED